MKPFTLLLILIGIISLHTTAAGAGECVAEPQDMQIRYGDQITCEISPRGDKDTYHFSGNKGDEIFFELSFSHQKTPLLKITTPSGKTLFNNSDFNGFTFEKTLPETGVYTLVIKELDHKTASYSLRTACNAGQCLSIPRNPTPIPQNPKPTLPIENFTQADIDKAKKEAIAQCQKNPAACGIKTEVGVVPSTLTYNATARLVPQVIMAGASPSVIDSNDNTLDVLAIVRAGAVGISRVSLSQNGNGAFRINMSKIAELSNGDQVWKSEFSFERGGFGTGIVPISWGDKEGQFSIKVTDGQQNSKSFPVLEAGNFPILK
jgi:hypothetical protein